MRVLKEEDGFPPLQACQIALVWAGNSYSDAVKALADHVIDSLGNLSSPLSDMPGDPSLIRTIQGQNGKRLRPGHIMAGW